MGCPADPEVFVLIDRVNAVLWKREGQPSRFFFRGRPRIHEISYIAMDTYSNDVDCPPGRTDAMASAITGGMLRYFTPDPLPTLLKSCRRGAKTSTVAAQVVPDIALALAGPASKRRGRIDGNLAGLHIDVALGRLQLDSAERMIALGQRIGPRSKALRCEMVYADAPIPSLARQIYAHHERLPELMASLYDAFDSPEMAESLDAVTLTAVTGFFCVQAHPFVDGNGRWSRLIAAAFGAKAGYPTEAMLCALFLNSCEDVLSEHIWPSSRSYGLRDYLYRVNAFTHAFWDVLDRRVVADIEWLNASVLQLAKSPRLGESLLRTLYRNGSMSLVALRKDLNLSAKVANSYCSHVLTECACATVDAESIGITPVWELISEAAGSARKSVFSNSN